jgi:hypothetical protein
MRTRFVIYFLSMICTAISATGAEVNDQGVISIDSSEAKVEGNTFSHTFKAPRWGMYTVHIDFKKEATVTSVNAHLVLQGKEISANRGTVPQRAYIAKAGECSLELRPQLPVGANQIAAVRLVPTAEGTAELAFDKDGKLVLPAKEATSVGRMLRYEPNPKKLCLGFWVNEKDYATWSAKIDAAGTYDVTVFQGCGKPNGGSKAEVVIAGADFEKRLPFKVVETGGFQDFIPVKVGQVEIPELKNSAARIEIRAIDKARVAVMDVQKIVLTKAK